MARRLICDTNVFYDQAQGRIDLSAHLQPGDTVWVSPLTVYELCAKLSPQSFADRRDAAKAILALNPQWLVNTDQHVCMLVGTAPPADITRYHDAVLAIAMAQDFPQLLSGVPDPVGGVVRTIDPSVAQAWLEALKGKWMTDHDAALERHIPKYVAYLAKPKVMRKRVPRIPAADRPKLESLLGSPEWHKAILGAMIQKAALSQQMAGMPAIDPLTHVPPATAGAALYTFGAIYGRYHHEQRTNSLRPEPNDSADIEYLLYVNGPDDRFVTGEDKWHRLAGDAGVGTLLLRP